jgi:hypothetical protein
MNSQKCKCASQNEIPFFSFAPLGLFMDVVSLSKGFTPGYTLSALWA